MTRKYWKGMGRNYNLHNADVQLYTIWLSEFLHNSAPYTLILVSQT